MDAYTKGDLQKAIAVWHRDDQIDGIYANLLIVQCHHSFFRC